MNSVAITHYISNTKWHLRRDIVRYKYVADLNVKIKLLKFTRDKTETTKDGAVITAMERHLKSLNTVLDDVDALRRDVEQSKFERVKNQRRLQNGAKN